MSQKGVLPRLKRMVGEADDICRMVSGRKLSQVVMRGWELFGEQILDKLEGTPIDGKEKAADVPNPYAILEVRDGASLRIVKAAFRDMARKYHPDTGTHPDVAKFIAVKEAYDAIMESRKHEEKP